MPTYLYGFGYETPRQARNNQHHGWDDENSYGLAIDADEEDIALGWGREVAERFVKLLYRDEVISWKRLGFADWIKPPPEMSLHVPVVKAGEYPDFEPWILEQAEHS